MTAPERKSCSHCGKTFERDKRYSRKYFARQKFCGQMCSSAAHGKRIAAKDAKPRLRNRSVWVGDCLEWLGATNGKYGVLSHQGRQTYAHRVSYIVHNGDLSDGEVVCHKCDNPLCINPEHLFKGSQRDNSIDMVKKGRQYNSSLTEADVLFIRASPEPAAILAKKYGLTDTSIYNIRNGRKWSHV